MWHDLTALIQIQNMYSETETKKILYNRDFKNHPNKNMEDINEIISI